jgi:hypothetical protein
MHRPIQAQPLQPVNAQDLAYRRTTISINGQNQTQIQNPHGNKNPTKAIPPSKDTEMDMKPIAIKPLPPLDDKNLYESRAYTLPPLLARSDAEPGRGFQNNQYAGGIQQPQNFAAGFGRMPNSRANYQKKSKRSEICRQWPKPPIQRCEYNANYASE